MGLFSASFKGVKQALQGATIAGYIAAIIRKKYEDGACLVPYVDGEKTEGLFELVYKLEADFHRIAPTLLQQAKADGYATATIAQVHQAIVETIRDIKLVFLNDDVRVNPFDELRIRQKAESVKTVARATLLTRQMGAMPTSPDGLSRVLDEVENETGMRGSDGVDLEDTKQFNRFAQSVVWAVAELRVQQYATPGSA